jgi:DNA gyrase subunit A
VDLREDDQLVGVAITNGEREVMLFTSDGKAIRFHESAVRSMGRTACGVRGIRLAEGQRVISLVIVDDGDILMATERGYGKRTTVDQFPIRGRGGQGVISITTSERNGPQVGAVLVEEEDEIMLITDGGTLVRTRVADVSLLSRNTQGVTLIRLSEKEKLAGLERIEPEENAAGEDGADESSGSESEE